jgi:uncharacterized membrane protein (UPF0182 family)
VYVRSSQGTQFPLLQKVFVSFGDEVGFADTLSQALDQVFGEGAAPDDPVVPEDPETPAEPDTPTDPDDGELGPELDAIAEARNDLRSALVTARQAIDDSRAALADGDFTAYGQAQERLAAALEDAVAAQEALDAALDAAEDEAQAISAST